LFDIQLSKTGYASKTYPDIAVIAVSLSMVKADSDVADAISKKHSVGDSIASSISDGDTTHSPDGNSVFDALALKLDASSVLDDDTMAANSAVLPVSQQSALAYFMAKTGANLAVGSDADGDTYHRAAGVLARLAKGAANTKMFMNAAGTAPEWASGIKLGTFTRAMDGTSGDVAYTAVGFKPSAIIFIVGHTTSAGWGSIGFSDGTLNYCQFSNSVASTGTQLIDTSKAIVLLNTGSQVAIVKTMDADGFTLTWTLSGNAGTSTATGIYIALR